MTIRHVDTVLGLPTDLRHFSRYSVQRGRVSKGVDTTSEYDADKAAIDLRKDRYVRYSSAPDQPTILVRVRVIT